MKKSEFLNQKFPVYIEDPARLTMYGVLVQHFDEIFIGRNEDTQEQYCSFYAKKLLPKLQNYPIRELRVEKLDEVIRDVGRGLEDSTVGKYRFLLWDVIEKAANYGYCENILLGTKYTLTENQLQEYKELRQNGKYKLPKSFTPEQEAAIKEDIMTDPGQSGQKMGIVLLFGTGIRLNEACGVLFGSIKKLFQNRNRRFLFVVESTSGNTNEVKAGSKTANGGRKIPTMDEVEHFIWKRREYLKTKGFTDQEIDKFPVACDGDDYSKHCSSRQLSAAANELFERIGMKAKDIAFLDLALSEDKTAEKLYEKNPTAYLFRRNFATHLFVVGLSMEEIQYVMGHDIEQIYETRAQFGSKESLLAIAEKMARRPLVNEIRPAEQSIELQNGCSTTIDADVKTAVSCKLKPGILRQNSVCREASDRLSVKVETEAKGIQMTLSTYGDGAQKAGESINCLKRYYERYALLPKTTDPEENGDEENIETEKVRKNDHYF